MFNPCRTTTRPPPSVIQRPACPSGPCGAAFRCSRCCLAFCECLPAAAAWPAPRMTSSASAGPRIRTAFPGMGGLCQPPVLARGDDDLHLAGVAEAAQDQLLLARLRDDPRSLDRGEIALR